jgi:hypothetical protein
MACQPTTDTSRSHRQRRWFATRLLHDVKNIVSRSISSRRNGTGSRTQARCRSPARRQCFAKPCQLPDPRLNRTSASRRKPMIYSVVYRFRAIPSSQVGNNQELLIASHRSRRASQEKPLALEQKSAAGVCLLWWAANFKTRQITGILGDDR